MKIPIWQRPLDLEAVSLIRKDTLVDLVGIEFLEVGDDFFKGRMPVDHRTKQPYGIMHGGASCVLAETLASIASYFCVNPDLYRCVGLTINTNHIRMATSGYVTGIATPINLGKQIQIWEVPIYDESERLVSVTRMTMAVILNIPEKRAS